MPRRSDKGNAGSDSQDEQAGTPSPGELSAWDFFTGEPVTTADPPARSDDALDNLTPAEKEYLRGTLPSEEDVMLGWALPLLAAPEAERRDQAAWKIAVLEGLYDDPQAWVERAFELAAAEVDHHGR